MDSGTTNTILREKMYFQSIKNSFEKVMTITGSDKCIVGTGRATIILPIGTTLHIEEAILYPKSKKIS